ncbi:MAG TPA: hypothetical protein VE522_03820 [Actinomycetota bacterium]|nr:hypothetical protein [Actinomycetota bacterium]
MRVRRAFAILLVIAAGCGGNAGSGPAPGDYFGQLQRVSENAHIQERGLRRDLRIRLDEAPPGEDRMTVLTVFIDQSAGLYRDVVDALGQLDPPPELATPQRAYREAWRSQLELVIAVRDAGFAGPMRILTELGRPAFRDAGNETKARCEDLQAAVEASGSNVDLACDGRPA